MGYSTRPGTTIRDFWPDEDDNTMYIYGESNLSELIEKIQEKWVGISLDEIEISSEYIQTHCLGYDQYDPGDYNNFTVIRKVK